MEETAGDTTILRVSQYGMKPDTGEDACEAIGAILTIAGGIDHKVIIEFESGRYDFYDTYATKEQYCISGTASMLDIRDHTKRIGMHIKGMSNITIEGNGALFVYHGKMVPIVVDESQDIEIKRVSIDYERPTVSEMIVEAVHETAVDYAIHPDSWYAIEGNQLVWMGQGWRSSSGPAQVTDPHTGRTWRTGNPVTEASHAEELESYKVRLHYNRRHEAMPGHIYLMWEDSRDQAGTIVVRSKNIVFDQVHYGYAPGYGLTAQYSDNLTLQHLHFAPREGTGRTAAAFSAFVRMIHCTGKLGIYHNNFSGSHGDAVQVYGMRGNPCVEIIGNRFASVAMRGVRIAAGGKTVIRSNAFHRMPLSGILIDNGADSGMASPSEGGEVTIDENYFIKCGDPVVFIEQRREEMPAADHIAVSRIAIKQNFFYLDGTTVVDAQGAQDLVIQGNEVVGTSPARNPIYKLQACSRVVLKDNALLLPNKLLSISQMPVETVKIVGDPIRIVEKSEAGYKRLNQ
ncbi:right-handed parallel beta-helix repeat-containing protein [Paenibacillus sp. GCM10023248]|uniref:right-handed parallel beta-helix repeat-containing protein n=1 Tax=Bacillales TaxID=1385 RepID=UPI002378B072|nr:MULTISPECIES: right-handed parallel beta-helix repeat-containing protein [Bacillales]MDD9267050.1 right-handed parallel beta-helix repeat-containing protein [Paenibacillus sp. MAHUQ-63]MDR6881251.1 hypothetical protein [Bacillus sp. 3255]